MKNHTTIRSTWLIAILAIQVSCLGQITLDADFDSGSLDLSNSSVAGTTVTLAGRDNFNPGSWKWIYFSAANTQGIRPTFQIGDNFASGSSRLNNHEMVYSYDQTNWQFFDNNNRDAGQGQFTFFNNAPFTQDTVFVAYGLPHPYQLTVDRVAALQSSPWVAPTTSGNANLVVGQSSGGIDDLGRTIAPHDIYAFQVTDAAFASGKKRIVINGGVHANETLGNHSVDGLVDFLVSDDLEAARLRRYAEFSIYPMANPDGRFAGYNRSTVQHESRDPNRFWREDLYADMTDIQTVAEAMKVDTGADVDYFIDVHSATDTNQHYGILDFDQNFHLDPFWQNFLALEPATGSTDASLINWTGQKFGLERLSADFTMTLETEFIPGENIDRFHDFGSNLGRAFEQAFVVLGDLDFDSELTAADWLLFVAGAETDMSGLLPIEAYERGDLDGDGQNSISDFGIFKNSYENVNGSGAFRDMLRNIPEPDGSTIGLIALCWLGRIHRKLRQRRAKG